MFATIIVILPSHFTGGAVHLRHDGDEKIFATGGDMSTFLTSVLSWYSDVSHEVKPIESGYRFALSFNLIHTSNTLPPRAPLCNESTRELKRIFDRWNLHPQEAPDKLVHILSHKYSHANLRGNALKGGDIDLVSHLVSLAERFDFGIGLATLETVVLGAGEDNGAYHQRRGYRSYRDDSDTDDDDDVDNVSMGEVEGETTSLSNLVSLDGTLLHHKLKLNEELEITDPNWAETVKEGGPDHKEYEGYQGNVSDLHQGE
jgi:hypothetical protein